ncbi:MAG: hypothetical protein JXB62_19165 [Pirellulales bacterium]|nr:hypothetical protein [Pirellulales bacterium]
MRKAVSCLLAGLSIWAAGAATRADDASTYTLRYRFHPGETLRWAVEHRSMIDTTVSGSSQTAETFSRSLKAWRVQDVQPDGSATFVHSVESVEMRQKLAGCEEVRYNSRTDPQPPVGFRQVARSVGVPLSTVTLDARGNILRRTREQVKAAASEGQITVPLPQQPVPVGYTWSFPHEIDVKTNTGLIRKVKARQTFTLQSVKTGVATIGVATQILTPVDDPAIESQLIERASSGTVRFDIDAGRVIAQQMDLDKRLVGYPNPASSIHYLTRFTEKLLPAEVETASRSEELR